MLCSQNNGFNFSLLELTLHEGIRKNRKICLSLLVHCVEGTSSVPQFKKTIEFSHFTMFLNLQLHATHKEQLINFIRFMLRSRH